MHFISGQSKKLSLRQYCSQMIGFIAQLVEHVTGIADVMGSNPVEATSIFQVFKRQLVKLSR